MTKAAFNKLLASLEQARHFAKTGNIGKGRVTIPKEIDAAAIRARTGLSQADFAKQIRVSVSTLRNWEQGRRTPDGPARVLLAMLNKDPAVVQRTLKSAA